MVNRIKNEPNFSSIIDDTCCENGICVSFDESVSRDSYVIIKVDRYYNSLNIPKRPASADCLIVRECLHGGVGLTVVELKNIRSGSSFDFSNIKEKFETSLNDFVKNRFPQFLDLDYKEVKLYYVTNQEIYKRDLGLKMEALINLRFEFNGKRRMITPKMPDPTILNCY